MEQQLTNSNRGIPRYFIPIGMCLVILPVVFMAVTKLIYDDVRAEFGDHNRDILKVIFDSCIILGLTFMTLTRSKIENEATKNARITGIIGGFMAGIVMVLLTPLFDLFEAGPLEGINSRQLVMWMLIMSLVFRYAAKRGIQKQH